MPSIDDYANDTPDTGATAPAAEQEVTQRPSFQFPEWMKVKASREPIESFMEHPLNFARDTDLARAVRGITTMFSSFDYAVIDVIVGGLRFLKKKKQPVDISPGPHPGQV